MSDMPNLWERAEKGLCESNPLWEALKYLRHKNAQYGLVICGAEGLGFAGTSLEQRKAFKRHLSNTKRGWVHYTAPIGSIIGKREFCPGVPILNIFSEEDFQMKYGKTRKNGNGVPSRLVLMPPWHYCSAILSCNTFKCQEMAQTTIACTDLLRTLTSLKNPEELLRRIREVSVNICVYK